MTTSPTNYDAAIDLLYDGIISLINEEIKKRGWTRKKFASIVGMSGGWPSQIMSQKPETKTNLSLKALLKIALILDVHPASLIPDDSENKSSPKKGLEEYIRKIVQEEISKSK